MHFSAGTRVGVAGAAVVGVAFGMARYLFGLTLPDVRDDLGMSELLLGLVAGGTSAGYLVGLLLTGPLAAALGPRAPTTVGGACGAVGCLVVALAQAPWVLALGAVLAGTAAGWVWSPYSDIVGRVATSGEGPRLLAGISTGTSGGLAALGVLALVAPTGSWRLLWAATGVAALAAGVLNLRLVPALSPHRVARTEEGGALRWRALARPVGFAAVFVAACIVYFTYATDAARQGGLGGVAAPVVFVLVGTTGLVALWTGALSDRIGVSRLAGLCALAVGVALVLLATLNQSLPALALSAAVFGAGYMTGSAVLVIWTAQVQPRRPGTAFTVALVVGGASAVLAPVLVGALVPTVGLPALLLGYAAAAVLSGCWLVARQQSTERTASGGRRAALR